MKAVTMTTIRRRAQTRDSMVTIRQRIGAVIGRMTPEEAKATLTFIRRAPLLTRIRDITGGYNSQAINGHVIRKLGIKAGIIKNPK